VTVDVFVEEATDTAVACETAEALLVPDACAVTGEKSSLSTMVEYG
jgi:hypothetical protein